MPTDEWFKENPKISAYISPNLNEKLLEWMSNRGIKKVSQALTSILEVYLGVNQDRPIIESSENDRLRILEQKLENLSQEMRSLTEQSEKSSQRVVQFELLPVKRLEETLLDNQEAILIDAKQPTKIIEEVQKNEPDEEGKVEQIELIKREIWTTQQVSEILGFSRKSLESWKKKDAFPKTSNGYTILKWARKQTKYPFGNLWEVKKLDSADPKTIVADPEKDASDF